MEYEQLRLNKQICFPVYAASRLIIRQYQPYLEKLGITYPQYLALLVLWEENNLTVNDIAARLFLNTNTITPLLKRMEAIGIINRTRSLSDERKVIISLTAKGLKLKEEAAIIPEKLIEGLGETDMNPGQLIELRNILTDLVHSLHEREKDLETND